LNTTDAQDFENESGYRTWQERELWSAAAVKIREATNELSKIAASKNTGWSTEEATYYLGGLVEMMDADGGICEIIKSLTDKLPAEYQTGGRQDPAENEYKPAKPHHPDCQCNLCTYDGNYTHDFHPAEY
jgi:hypothetical protein